MPDIRRKTGFCLRKKNRQLPTMRSGMHWLQNRRIPHRFRKLPLFHVHRCVGIYHGVDEGEHFLGQNQELPQQDHYIYRGRAAEELVFKEVTTGASNDIEQATKLARAMLTQFGMSDEF